PRYFGPVTRWLARKVAWPEQSSTIWVSMSSLLPSGQRTVTPRAAPSSASSGFVAVPRITVAPSVSASLSIIVSKLLRRTCHVVENERFHPLSRAETGTYQEFTPLVPKTLTPCLTGCSLFVISPSKPSRRRTCPPSPVSDSPM